MRGYSNSHVDLYWLLWAHLLQELWMWEPHVLFPAYTYAIILSLARTSMSMGDMSLHTSDIPVPSS